MLLPVFLLFYQVTRFTYARLELVSLTRETAMFLIHENRSELPDGLVEELAKKTRLDSSLVSAKITGAGLSDEFSDLPVLGSMGKLATQFLLGSKLDQAPSTRSIYRVGKNSENGLQGGFSCPRSITRPSRSYRC